MNNTIPQNKVESRPNHDTCPAQNMLAHIALWSVSLSAVAAGGSVTQQFPCVTTVPACAGKGLAMRSLSSKRRWGITMLSQKKYTNVLRNVHMETCCTSEAAARRCAGIRSRFLPKKKEKKKGPFSAVVVCINTSGQYNFTRLHVHTLTISQLSFPL